MKKICVIGSLNIDIVSTVDRFPLVGETVMADNFEIFVGGGKGANQASAVGKLGGDVLLIGKISKNFYGPDYLKALEKSGVDCSGVALLDEGYPGIGLVTVDAKGDNFIQVFPGANGRLDGSHIDEQWDRISSCDFFLFQNEVPLKTSLYAMEKLNTKTIICDPAPAGDFPDVFFKHCDYLTPNETELEAITGIACSGDNPDSVEKAGRKLLSKGVGKVIAKAGKYGVFLISRDGMEQIPGYEVEAVDPTAAGDSFNGGFAYALSVGKSETEALRFANAVAALSVTAMGAQSAMPDLARVEEFMEGEHA